MKRLINLCLFNALITLLVPHLALGALTTKKEIPDFVNNLTWFNTDEPISKESLRGTVTLVHFFSTTCAECIREFPHLTAWHNKYESEGFTVIGVHRAEYDFEKHPDVVQRIIKDNFVFYPTVMDTRHELWNAFNVPKYPTAYLIDARSRIREVFDETTPLATQELLIQDLLKEKGNKSDLELEKFKELVDSTKSKTPDIYLGYRRLNHFGNPLKLRAEKAQKFTLPPLLDLDTVYLQGEWEMKEDHVILRKAPGSIWLRYRGNGLNMIAGTKNRSAISNQIRLNGAPVPLGQRTRELMQNQEDSFILINRFQLYRLADHEQDYTERTLSFTSEKEGLEVYGFSFGKVLEERKRTLDDEINERIDELVAPEEVAVQTRITA